MFILPAEISDCTVSTTVMCARHNTPLFEMLLCNSLQDLCQLVNADAPYWLVGMTEMTRTFGLELLESVLNDFPGVFLQVHATLHVMAYYIENLLNSQMQIPRKGAFYVQ